MKYKIGTLRLRCTAAGTEIYLGSSAKELEGVLIHPIDVDAELTAKIWNYWESPHGPRSFGLVPENKVPEVLALLAPHIGQ